VQTISNRLYWNIGELIIKKQQEYGWGKSIVEKLSVDLPQYVGDGASWSPRNLRLMRQLVDEYSNVKQAVSHLAITCCTNPNIILKLPCPNIFWSKQNKALKVFTALIS
jgi:hypothetical protein